MTTRELNGLLYLAIDQGGSSTRAIVFDARANVIARAQQSVPVLYPQAQWVEQDPGTLIDSVRQVIARVSVQLGADVKRLRAAGLATQRSNIVCWDKKTGEALSPAISWQDRRAHYWIKQFETHKEVVHKLTGLLLSAHYGVSKLRWCLDHLPEVKHAYHEGRLAWGPLASYLTSRLLGADKLYADPVNASRTLLWNLSTGHWDQHLLSLFNIPQAPLPQCVDTCYAFGDITLEDTAVPFSVVTGDQSAALFAYGRPDANTAYINMGTGAFIQCATGATLLDAPNLLSGIVYKDELAKEYVLECTVNGASNALMLMEDALNIPYDEAERNFNKWLAQYQDPPLYLNGIAGLGAPFWVPDFTSQFVPECNRERVPGEKIVAVAESILFLLQVNLQLLNKHYVKLDRIVVTGGLSQSDGLCQKLANLAQLPVCRPMECEATAQGLAYLLAGFPEEWPDQLGGFDFQPTQDAALAARYHHWLTAMHQQLANENH